MAKVRLTRNFSFADMLVRPDAAEMRQMGTDLRDRIEDRTLRGEDENGQPFKPYKGGSYKGKIVPNLHDSGRMFQDFQVIEAEPGKMTLGFVTRQSEDVARYHMEGTGSLWPRRFLGVPETWIEDIRRWFLRRVVKEENPGGAPSRTRGGRR